jgi:hypothetical protein
VDCTGLDGGELRELGGAACRVYLGGCEEAGRPPRPRDDRAARLFAGGCGGGGEILGGTIAFSRRSRWGAGGRGEREKLRLRGGGGENLLRKEEDDTHQLPGSRGSAPLPLSSLDHGAWWGIAV